MISDDMRRTNQAPCNAYLRRRPVRLAWWQDHQRDERAGQSCEPVRDVRQGVSKQDAVKIAIQAALDRATEAIPLRDRFAALRQAHKLPPATGNAADKAFFDDLSGEL